MGKNPNAARLKKNHRADLDSDPEDKMAALAEEAARLGCEVWDIEKVKAKLAMEEDSDEDDDSQEESKVE